MEDILEIKWFRLAKKAKNGQIQAITAALSLLRQFHVIFLLKQIVAHLTPSFQNINLIKVHYAHPLPDADNTGLSLKYQLTPPTYQAGILLMVTGKICIQHQISVILLFNAPLSA